MTNKQQVFNNMFESLEAGGKIAFQYVFCLPPFVFNVCKEMNPENAERICQKFQCESKSKIDKYIVNQQDLELPRVLRITAKVWCLETSSAF